MADNLTPEQRSLTMSRIRSRDTKVEMMVRRALHRRGHRYRVQRLLELAGAMRPRKGARMAPRTHLPR